MGHNIVQKILSTHLKEGEFIAGQEIGIRIDQTLTQDATGTMAYLQFESMGMSCIKTDVSVSYVDHNTVQVGFENADDHAYLQSIAKKYGIIFSRPGNGICHQVHLERFGKPGTTLLGSDSHTPTGGGIGQIAMGAGGLDVAVAMGGGLFYLNAPQVVCINLTGHLQPWVTAKDVVLKMLSVLGTKGNVGVILEYSGAGVSTLTVPERATITNMGAEMGVTTSIFPSDGETKAFLSAQKREQDWIELIADADAQYDRVIEINLSDIEPMVATPHSPGNVVTVKSLSGMPVNQVCIGSCTNSSYKDMVTVSHILGHQIVHSSISLGVAPGSRQVLAMLSHEGHLASIIDSGARILESACGFCIGNSMSPPSDGVSVRTINRNFEGRSGTKNAKVYLASCEVAAIAAIKGEFMDPRESGLDCPSVSMPENYHIDDRMFIFPEKNISSTEIIRGPNIGSPPCNDALPKMIAGDVMIVLEDKITTDHIMPAGPRLKYRSNVEKYATYVFEHVDASFSDRCLANKQMNVHNIIVAGESYGQGSSREHAAICPMYLGVKAVIAKSFERIHAANLVNFGILPIIVSDIEGFSQNDRIEISDTMQIIAAENSITIHNQTKNKIIDGRLLLSDRQKRIVLAGGLLNDTNNQAVEK